MKKWTLKFLVGVNFLCDKAPVTAAMPRDMVGGTHYCNGNSTKDLQLFLYNRIPNFFLSLNRIHHVSGIELVKKREVRLSASLKFSGTLSTGH